MNLLKIENYKLEVDPYALTLKPFKALYDRDKSKDKERFIQEVSFIWLMQDTRSDYKMYIDPEERKMHIKQGEGLKDNWEPDKLVLEAMEFYNSFKSDGELLLEDLRVMVNNLRSYLKKIDLEATDDNGKPIYNIDTYTKTVTDLNKLIKSLDETEKTITKELIQSDKVRGAATKSMYEDI